MEDFEDRYKNAVEAGQRNLKAKNLLCNWCYHAEFDKSAGRGMIEATTGLPIGHMGVQCKFSKKNSMHCWLLEDAVYDFYLNNCKDCSERVPVNIPNIMEFIIPREKAAQERRKARDAEENKRQQEKTRRQEERSVLRSQLSLEETFVLDLLDDLDQEDIERGDPRLEQLANLAPETFTRRIIEHLLPAVLYDHLPYSIPAAIALLKTPLEPEEKVAVAMRLVGSFEKSAAAIEVVLGNADQLSKPDFDKALRRFTSLALGPRPGLHFGGSEPIRLDANPIKTLFNKRRDDVRSVVNSLIADANPSKIGAAVEIILATDDSELLAEHLKTIFAKLMRRRVLLPDERQDSSVLYYLRKASSRCLELFPEKADGIIQSFLADREDTGRKEAYMTYSSVIQREYGEVVQIGMAQKVAFKRLLWAAVESPDDSMNDAGQFFRHSWDEFAQLAVENFDDLIGAAATLSEKYEAVGAERTLELTDDALIHMDERNKRSAIDSLQGALIEWAAVGARSKGVDGIEEFLNLYRSLPEDQTQMRGNMIVHISKLLTGVDSLILVLSDWYRALMDENAVVRASAVQAWENVPYKLVKNFPDLFFEAFSVLLTDPYVVVHKSAVRSLRRRSFPKGKRELIKDSLWNLIVYYAQEDKQNEFVVDCIDAFTFLCLSPEEREGELGLVISGILQSLEGGALYRAVDRLHFGFVKVPGFVKVALKAIQDDYTRSISTDDCMTAILRAPNHELHSSIDEIKRAFEALRPFRPEDFLEALLFAAALTKAGDAAAAGVLFRELVASIPPEDRNQLWRLEAASVATAVEIEHLIGSGEAFSELIENWANHLTDLENENEERAKLRDFPPSIFFEN